MRAFANTFEPVAISFGNPMATSLRVRGSNQGFQSKDLNLSPRDSNLSPEVLATTWQRQADLGSNGFKPSFPPPPNNPHPPIIPPTILSLR